MEQEYSKDFFWNTYKQLPEDLKESLFSDKNNEVINHICAQAGLNEEQTASVAKFTGRVLMGLLPLDEFPLVIELELNIGQGLANQINRQIYISIFKHLRVSLNKINDVNYKYKDSFTSESDGKEEEAEQKKEKDIIPKLATEQSATPVFFAPPKENILPLKDLPKNIPQIKNELLSQDAKEPPFAYSEPQENIPLPKQQSSVIPKMENQIKENKNIEAEKPIPNIPNRTAFEQELQKNSMEILVSLPNKSNTIPITIKKPEPAINKEPLIPKPAEEPKIITPKNNQIIPSAPLTKPINIPVPSAPKIPLPDNSENSNKEDAPKNPFAKIENNNQSKDPYKEIPI